MRKYGNLLLCGLVLLANACVPTQSNVGTAPAPPPTSSTPAAATAAAPEPLVVLPLMDALFYDGSFVKDLESKVGLSSAEIEKVRAIVHEEYGKQADMSIASEEQSERTAQARVRETVGDEKATKLFALVRERWGTADAKVGEIAGTVPTDSRVVVNAPAYRMDVWENGKLVKTYKVGIGYPEFPLAAGLRRAETIVFNPEWVPPDEPWIVKEKVEAGERVKPGDPRNPLGPLKIPLGGGTLIHGGKAQARLGSFASHGCIGLTTPQATEFTLLLARIAGEKLGQEQVRGYLKSKTETKHVALDKPIPVELRYDTIVVEGGKLHIYRDVYGKGTNTEENLRQVLTANGVDLEQLPEKAAIVEGLQAMALDAFGKPAEPGSPGTAKQNRNTETKSMKGDKVRVFEIAALADKGYPAPFELDNGTGKPAKEGETTTGVPEKKASAPNANSNTNRTKSSKTRR